MDAAQGYKEMPRYQCHKKVWALKIANIEPAAGDQVAGPNQETDGGSIITPEDDGFAPFRVESDYIKRHMPSIGGYYVVYEDGYKSFSPAEPFESGYTRI